MKKEGYNKVLIVSAPKKKPAWLPVLIIGIILALMAGGFILYLKLKDSDNSESKSSKETTEQKPMDELELRRRS